MSTQYLLVCIITTFFVTKGDFLGCGVYFDAYGVTFDISTLTLTEDTPLDYYVVSSTDGDYDHVFNLCSDIVSNPYATECHTEPQRVLINGNIIQRAANVSSQSFQAEANQNGTGGCWRTSASNNENMYNISSNLIEYQLIDETDPSFGFIIHYNYGDYCFGSINREFDIRFVCNPLIKNTSDLFSNAFVAEVNDCEYLVEVHNIYGCPLECLRDNDGILCSGNGVCGYDHALKTAECRCYSGWAGDVCETEAPFFGNKSWYNIAIDDTSPYIYTFSTANGFDVTYDLQYIINGYYSDKYYTFIDYFTPPHKYFLNLFTPANGDDNVNKTVCENELDYEYGYIYQSSPNTHRCYSLGRNYSVNLYDDTMPTKGIHIQYYNGDSEGCYDQNRETDVYFICDDSNRMEIYRDINGLNYYYSTFIVNELTTCKYIIEIYTVAACPYQCITTDTHKDSISQCNANGLCAYDYNLETIRCFCEDNVIVDQESEIFCNNPDITYPPTTDPTEDPTFKPSYSPTKPTEEPTNNPSIPPTKAPTEVYSLYGTWTHYDIDTDLTLQFDISIGSQCEYVKFSMVTPGCNDNIWAAFGIGGNYDFDSSDDQDESNKMNGYSIININGDIPDGYNQTYESTLEPGTSPLPQIDQNLINCRYEIINCLKYTVCYRDLVTSDSSNDYFSFREGINYIIWAYGHKDINTNLLLQHEHDDAHGGDSEFIYLEGESLCMMDTSEMPIEFTKLTQDENQISTEDNGGLWMTIAIVFIILFIISLLWIAYAYYKTKKATNPPRHTRVNSNDIHDNNEMININTSTS